MASDIVMVKDHSDSQRGTPPPPLYGLLFPISNNGSFICTIPQTGQYIPRSLLYQSLSSVEREIAQWVRNEGSFRRPTAPSADVLPRSYISVLPTGKEGNVLFNDALNTFYLRSYGVRHMVKYHTDSER